ncbi:MAG TPA: malate dehydrogenase [Mycobacterium sp.]|jgi:hypothetical protein|uniref:malate dehydrogenase n=1 Tax=Mycobacterium sp. TaxID=1785 RepID=UPI002F413361
MTDLAAHTTTTTLVKGLGGASLGLGLSELLAPTKVAAIAGINDTSRSRVVIRALGMRECGHAAAVLSGPSELVWTRVAGDVLDLALLGSALARSNHRRRRQRGTASALALVVIGAVDLYTALRTTGSNGPINP